jgi:hypothetical protein
MRTMPTWRPHSRVTVPPSLPPCTQAAPERSFRTVLAALAALLLMASAAPLHAAGPATLPPEHWAYAELEHFEARGWIRLPGARPYSRHQVARWVETLDAQRATAPAGEAARIARLLREFGPAASPADRDDPPLAAFADQDWSFAGDIAVQSGGQAVERRAAGDETTSGWSHGRFETVLDWRDWVAYDTRYSIALEEEGGTRSGENRLSSRERNWHGLTSDNDRAYLAFERGPLRASLGRDYIAWGPRRGAELLVSDAGLSHDALTLRLRLQRFQLSSVTGLLSSSRERWFAAHRLDVDLGPLSLGFQEAAVYQSPNLEPAYFFPVSFYYGNQFNERADDNVLLGADIKWVHRFGVVDGELLVDDFIYDGDPAPQKVGWRIGASHVLALGGGAIDLRGDYTRVTRWTFTHRDSNAAYVAGGASAGDPLLGTPLGPDADRIGLEARWVPDARRQVWLRGERTRRGDGNRDRTGWVPGSAYDLPFPSGTVVQETRVELGSQWRFGRHVEFLAAGGLDAAPGGRRARGRVELRLDL